VAKTDTGQMLVGLTDADWKLMENGRTCVKQGNSQYGFRSLIVFRGKSDKEMIALLNTQAAVRNDDLMSPPSG